MAESLGNAIGGVGGYYKWREGRKMQREAQNAIDNFEWQNLENPYKDLQVSTMGADLQREEMGRAFQSSADSLRAAGTRGLGVGLGRLFQANTVGERQIAADLDQQRKQINLAAAQDDTRIRDMIESRQSNELAGYGQRLNVGMNMKYAGTADIMNAIQAEGKHQEAMKEKLLGAFTGGMGGGMMGGGGGMMPSFNSGLPPMQYGNYFNDNAATYANNYGTMVG